MKKIPKNKCLLCDNLVKRNNFKYCGIDCLWKDRKNSKLHGLILNTDYIFHKNEILFKATCSECGKNRGFKRKNKLGKLCRKCACLTSPNMKINRNYQFLKFRHLTPFQGEVLVRSSYESFYIDYLNTNRINFYYEPKKFKFKDGSTYTPDFYLPDEDVYIELKGFMRDDAKEKIAKFYEEFKSIKLKVLYTQDLNKLGYKASSYKNSYVIKLHDDKWLVSVFPDDKFDKLFDEKTEAITEVATKRIIFRQSNACKYDVVSHELAHAFVSQIDYSSAQNLDGEDLEEMFIDFFIKHMFVFLGKTMLVYRNNCNVLNKTFKHDFKPEFNNENLDIFVKNMKKMKFI
ncbi:MAG: hypothetical protein RLY43_2347 [Bacteroidota bacterium]